MTIWTTCVIILSLYCMKIECLLTHPDTFLTTKEVANKYGYPLEHHYVTTPDNYILLMHRIPHGKVFTNNSTPRIPILFINGLGGSSDNFLLAGPDKAIGYFLADSGYDIWLGNGRGNRYSRNHTTLNPDLDKHYWNFSWHEIGVTDIPAKIDYILNLTKQEKLFTAGLSQGVTCTVVTLSERPEYNEKVMANFLLAPSIFSTHMSNPIVSTAARFHRFFEELSETLELYELIPNNYALNKLVQGVCSQSKTMLEICLQLLFATGGYGNGHNLDRYIGPAIFMQLPAGVSVKQVIHYAQLVGTDKFRQYDYGRRKNLIMYNKTAAPDYNISAITTEMVFFYGYNDWLASPQDVKKVMKMLPNKVWDIPVHHYNHYDFVSSNDIMERVNKPVLKIMKKVQKREIKK